jgi:hypothetical protein
MFRRPRLAPISAAGAVVTGATPASCQLKKRRVPGADAAKFLEIAGKARPGAC